MGYFLQAIRDRARYTELRRDIERLTREESGRIGVDRADAERLAASHVYGV
jgi:hypothetical protein